MRCYIAHSFKHRDKQAGLLDTIIQVLSDNGHEAFIFSRHYPNFQPGQEKQMMTAAIKEMELSDCIIAEVSTKEIGVGLEIGFFAAKQKPIVYIYKEGSDFSTTVNGVADKTIVYKSVEDVRRQLNSLDLLSSS